MGKIAIITITTLLFFSGLFFSSCNKANDNSVIEIRETMFLTQVKDVYINAKGFEGRTIKLEGSLRNYSWDGNNFYYVARNAPGGCCGDDEMAGFEVRWPLGRRGPFPEVNEWVQATGVLKISSEGHFRNPYLELVSLNVLETRGAEFVTR